MKQFTVQQVIDVLSAEHKLSETNRYFSGELTRRDIARKLSCSYGTANRLVTKAEALGLVKVRWTHQHQSYWEAWFSIA